MNMTYDGVLVMPNNYVVMDQEEMTYVDGGIAVTTILAIVGTALAAGGACYGAGTVVGERLYHAGMTSTEWKKYKWQVRYLTTCYGVFGISFMLGLENKFYSKLESK